MDNNAARWVKIALALVFLSVVITLLTFIGGLVKLIIIAALFAYIIDPAAGFLESRGLGRTSATTIIFLFIGVLTGIFIFFFLPILTKEVIALQSGFDYGRAKSVLSNLEAVIENKMAFLGINDLHLAERSEKAIAYLGEWLLNHLLDMVSLLTNLIIGPFIVFFLLKDGREMKKKFIGLLPNRYFEFSSNLLYKMDLQLGNYLRGQFIDAAIVGLLSIAALGLLNIKYFFIIGAFAGLANLIPYLGPVAGAVLAILASVIETGDVAMTPYIVIAFILIRMIDDVLIQPLIVARSVEMHPLLVLLAVIIGGKLFGMLGMLLSVPVTGFIRIALKESLANFRRYRIV